MIQKEWDAAVNAASPVSGQECAEQWRDACHQLERLDWENLVEYRPCITGNEAMASYLEARFPALDGAPLAARFIRPAGEGPFPLVLMFHDEGRPVRGWHHMTRFVALGCAVFALQNRPNGTPDQKIADALAAACAAIHTAGADRRRLYAWGEGLGGTLSVAVAGMAGVSRCVALNPLCTGPYACCAGFAALMKNRLLMGTGGMDPLAPPEAQAAVFAAAGGPKRHILYPKHAHERINAFEDQMIVFLHPAAE